MHSLSLIPYAALSLLYHIPSVVSQAALEPTGVTGTSEFIAPTETPELQGQREGAQCGGCYLVADVAGLVWYSEVFINTAATAMVSVGVANGSRATRTSVIQDVGDFTFNPAATGDTAPLPQIAFEPTVTVSGAILSSPTAYNVFTAYSVTSAYLSDGLCVTDSGTRIELPTAYSEVLPSASGRVRLDANGQQSFIDSLGFTTCSAGGENIVPTALLQVTNTTETMTTTFTGLLAVKSQSIAPQSTPASASASTSLVFPSAAAPAVVLGNSTVTPGGSPIALQIYNGTILDASAVSTGVVPVGPSGNLSTDIPEPYLGGAKDLGMMNGWLVVWIIGMISFGGFVYYL